MSGFIATLRGACSESPVQTLLIVGLALAAGCVAGYRILGPALLG